MKKTKHHLVIVWIFMLVISSGCTSQNEASDNHVNISASSENIRITEIPLPGMFCQACARNAKIAFQGIDGCIDATVDIEKRTPVIGNVSGGLSGPAVKPVALWKIHQTRAVASRNNIPILGQGGLTTPHDAVEFAITGADA